MLIIIVVTWGLIDEVGVIISKMKGFDKPVL